MLLLFVSAGRLRSPYMQKKVTSSACFISLVDHFNGDPKRCPRYLGNILLKNSWNYRQRREEREEGELRWNGTSPCLWVTHNFSGWIKDTSLFWLQKALNVFSTFRRHGRVVRYMTSDSTAAERERVFNRIKRLLAIIINVRLKSTAPSAGNDLNLKSLLTLQWV